MSIEKPKFEKKEKREPVIDIETEKSVLEEWEKFGLKSEIEDFVFGFNELFPPGERAAIHSENFESTDKFVKKAEKSFKKFKANNLEAKVKETEDNTRKSILAFAVNELGIDPYNPEIAKTEEIIEEIEGEKKKLIVRHFKTNQPNLFLIHDTIDWYLESQAEEEK